MLPILLMAVSAWQSWRDIRQRAEVEVERSALAVAQYGERVLSLRAMAAARVADALRGLAETEIRARQADLQARLQAILEELAWAEGAYVLNRDGVVLLTVRGPSMGRNGAATPHHRILQAQAVGGSPRFHVSGVHADEPGAAFHFAVSLRLDDPVGEPTRDGFAAVVYLPILLDSLMPQLAALVADNDDTVGLVRSDGEVLARNSGFVPPARVADAVSAAIGAEPPAAMRIAVRAEMGGRHYLAALYRIEGWPVYGTAARPMRAVVEQWLQAVARQLLIGVPASLLLLGMAFAVRQANARLAGANQDLEQRVAARTGDLAESRQRLIRALRAGRVIALEYDAGSGRVFRSPNAAEILGLPAVAACEHSPAALLAGLDPRDRRRVLTALVALTPERPDFALRVRHPRPDGSAVCLQVQGSAKFGANGRLHSVSSLAHDLTAEAEAEAGRRKAELRLRAATEGAGLGIYEIDFERGLAWFDARAAEVLGSGFPADTWVSLAGPEWAALEASIHPDDRAAFSAAWDAVASGGAEGWAEETRLRRPDGGWRWDWCHGSVAERDPATGRPLRLIGMLQDITERRQLEAELRQAQKLEALGSLAGGIAHDFNNVLQAVAGAASLIQRDAGNVAAIHRRSAMLTDAVKRGASITGRLLAFARRNEPRAVPLDAAELLQGLKEVLAAALGSRITIRVEAAPGLPPLLAEPQQLQTALINLATNARDAMPGGGILTLAAAAERIDEGSDSEAKALGPGAYLRITVGDTGEGMDAATLARATEQFFTTKPAGVGTGLGLSMAKAFARQSGGGFAIASAPGQGTTVTLWLPQAATSTGAAAPCCASQPAPAT
ncbi:ATP-binding protein [Roseomonas sp. AR75]|uniref:ATP-binding protein n=1 Tax=Roseomonas sp. AR75 TaxID=2562311 RepID=UPI0010C15654|nr:ATP-binding protein [Roseomonas sp. AR75]